jgi:beta-carotene hydroxylase
MQLRFIADRRALVWALFLFPALPALSYLRPWLAPWLLPLGLYLAYCSGVLAHNHNHSAVFRSKRLNSLYSAWLSFFYGCPLFVWVPTHNQNHHRFLDGPGDATRTSVHAERDTLWAALSYPTRSAIAQAPAIWHYARAARSRNGARFRQILLETLSVVLGHGAAFALAVYCYGFGHGALLYACAFGIPGSFAAWAMMFTNYVQHVGCDHASPDNHSRNFVSRAMNWWVFEAGYHTVHHEHAGIHWSAYPALHAWRGARIAPHLTQRTILGYCFERYVLGRAHTACGDAPALTETDCDTAGLQAQSRNYG